VRRKTRYILGVLVALGGICVVGAAILIAYTRNACQTEERLKIEDPSGFTFDVVYESCDTLAKDEAISVYARKAASKGTRAFSGWRNQRTLLFRYDPMRADSPLPTISRQSPSTILISIPEISEINYQNHKWENISINYEIGRVYYPSATK
jgi:hypothetical protein